MCAKVKNLANLWPVPSSASLCIVYVTQYLQCTVHTEHLYSHTYIHTCTYLFCIIPLFFLYFSIVRYTLCSALIYPSSVSREHIPNPRYLKSLNCEQTIGPSCVDDTYIHTGMYGLQVHPLLTSAAENSVRISALHQLRNIPCFLIANHFNSWQEQ